MENIKIMEKRKFVKLALFTFAFVSLFMSCNSASKDNKDQMKIDSLTNLAKNQQEHISEMEDFVNSLSQTIDSINKQENEILNEGDIEKGKPLSKKAIINSLKRYKETIDKQKELIANLEKQLSSKNDEMSAKMLQIVSFYKKQLEEKDATIASLQRNISENKRNISELKTTVDNLVSTNEAQKVTINEQRDVMIRQTNMINTCYVIIGSKKELKAQGLLETGFLKKAKINESMLTSAKSTKRDMRDCNDILIYSSKPKILTQMPSNSYSFVKNADGTCYLHIIDPNAFWSISRYLVIQL